MLLLYGGWVCCVYYIGGVCLYVGGTYIVVLLYLLFFNLFPAEWTLSVLLTGVLSYVILHRGVSLSLLVCYTIYSYLLYLYCLLFCVCLWFCFFIGFTSFFAANTLSTFYMWVCFCEPHCLLG